MGSDVVFQLGLALIAVSLLGATVQGVIQTLRKAARRRSESGARYLERVGILTPVNVVDGRSMPHYRNQIRLNRYAAKKGGWAPRKVLWDA